MIKKALFQVDHPEFSSSRFRTYHGNIGELVSAEVLEKSGYEVWMMRPFLQRIGGLLMALAAYRMSLNEEELRQEYMHRIDATRKDAGLIVDEYVRRNLEYRREHRRHLTRFFGDKLESFNQYLEKLGIFGEHGRQSGALYSPDLTCKKEDEIYVVEVKANSGINYLKGRKLEGLMLAKEYGFIPMLITIKVQIEAANLKAIALA